MDEQQQLRIAGNEIRFREVNERHAAQAEEVLGGDVPGVEVMCECSMRTCEHMISVTVDAYRDVRSDPARFIVMPQHFIEAVETPVEKASGYWVLEKVGAGRRRAVEEA